MSNRTQTLTVGAAQAASLLAECRRTFDAAQEGPFSWELTCEHDRALKAARAAGVLPGLGDEWA